MRMRGSLICNLGHTILALGVDGLGFLGLMLGSRTSVAAENLLIGPRGFHWEFALEGLVARSR